MLRQLSSSLSNEAVQEIDRRLTDIVTDHRVTIPWAIESGSRAWGFPSPDSDYDCRFIFVRSLDDYLSPWQKRDVIETPLVDLIDLNGWELGKALKLLLKGNAVVVEWLSSPIIYQGDAFFRDGFADLASRVVDPVRTAFHYWHLCDRHRANWGDGDEDTPLKKAFYALRPAAALRWLRQNPGQAIAPMHFPTLLSETDLPSTLMQEMEALMKRKAVTRELGSGPIPSSFRHFVDTEMAAAQALLKAEPKITQEAARELAAHFFRQSTQRFGK